MLLITSNALSDIERLTLFLPGFIYELYKFVTGTFLHVTLLQFLLKNICYEQLIH